MLPAPFPPVCAALFLSATPSWARALLILHRLFGCPFGRAVIFLFSHAFFCLSGLDTGTSPSPPLFYTPFWLWIIPSSTWHPLVDRFHLWISPFPPFLSYDPTAHGSSHSCASPLVDLQLPPSTVFGRSRGLVSQSPFQKGIFSPCFL